MDSLVGLLVWCAVLVTTDGALLGGTDDPVGISFLDCAGSSVLARAPTSQEEVSIYTSIPEVRLGFPQRYLDMINDTYDGDHFEFMSEQQFILENRPLYGDKLVIGDQRDYALQFLVDDGDVPTRCGGCFYQALVQNSSYRHGCSADIIIDVPTDCVRTSFHVDWIEPSDVTEESVFVTRSDIAREGPAPGDAFNPGVHTISYRPTERNSDFENCTFSVTLNANCPADSVGTIIGPMQFSSTRVGSFSNSTLRFCPLSFGNMTLSTANVPRAVASCIYNADLGPVWRAPADLTDCLKGVSDRFTLILQVLNEIRVKLEQKLLVSHNEIVEVGLAIDSFSRLNDDNVDDPDFINQNAQLLRELIRLNITSVEVTNIVLSVVNNLFGMETDNNDAADDRSLNGILTSLEDQARNQISSGLSYAGVEENVALFNVVLNGTGERVTLSFGNFKLELSDPDESVLGELDQSMLRTTGDRIDTPQNAVLTSISLPKNIQTLTNGGSLMVSFFLYRDGSLFQSTGQTVGLLGPSVRQVVGSQVIATIIHNVNASSTFNQSDQLVTTFTPITVANEDEQLLQDRICVFWNTETRRWSTEGCTLNISSSSRVVCQCTHATSFAILVNVEEQNPVFTWISQIGVTISAFALLVTIFSILSVRKLREKTPWKVHVSLMFALLGLYLVFLFGADQTAYRNVCIVIAGVMHYFLLASFMWMFFEGVLLYKSIVNTRVNNILPRFVWYSSVAAWGLPVLPAIAPTVLHYADDQYKLQEFYELETYCFLKPDSLMMFVGLIGVMAGILAFNFLIFIMIVARLRRRRSDRNGQGYGRKLVTFVAIICLFGLTWFIGFFAIRDATYAVSVAFATLNAFQGFLIFLLFALREKAILQLWASPCIGLKKLQSSKSAASSRRNGTKKSDGTASGAARSNPSFSNAGPTTDD